MMTEPCAVCGEPVTVVAVTEAPHKMLHGACYRRDLEQRGLLEGGPLTLYSHDEKVRDGVEHP